MAAAAPSMSVISDNSFRNELIAFGISKATVNMMTDATVQEMVARMRQKAIATAKTGAVISVPAHSIAALSGAAAVRFKPVSGSAVLSVTAAAPAPFLPLPTAAAIAARFRPIVDPEVVDAAAASASDAIDWSAALAAIHNGREQITQRPLNIQEFQQIKEAHQLLSRAIKGPEKVSDDIARLCLLAGDLLEVQRHCIVAVDTAALITYFKSDKYDAFGANQWVVRYTAKPAPSGSKLLLCQIVKEKIEQVYISTFEEAELMALLRPASMAKVSVKK